MKFLSSFLAIFFFWTHLAVYAHPETAEIIYRDIYEHLNAKKFYVIDEEALSKLGPCPHKDAFKNAVEDQFLARKKYQYYKIMGQNSAWLAGLFALLYGGYQWTKRSNSQQSGVTSLLAGASMLWFSNLALEYIQRFVSAFSFAFITHNYDPFEDYEIAYMRQKKWMSPELQKVTEEALLAAHLEQGSYFSYIDFLRNIIDLPTAIKPVDWDEASFDQKFHGYAKEVKETLKEVAIEYTLLNRSKASTYVPSTIVCMIGEPDTGKSFAAKALAGVLDIPFVTISLADVSIDKLVGTPRDSMTSRPGLIAEALMMSKRKDNRRDYKNMVILLDEAPLILNDLQNPLGGFIRLLLEPMTKSFSCPYFNGAELDISHVLFMIAGNEPINDPALQTRLKTINFPPFSLEFKKEVIWQTFIPQMLESVDFPSDRRDLLLEHSDQKAMQSPRERLSPAS